jgi:hypothetical protein
LLSRGTEIREDYVREKLKWYNKKYEKTGLLESIQKINDKELYNDLAKFLPKNYRKILHDLKAQILKRLEP